LPPTEPGNEAGSRADTPTPDPAPVNGEEETALARMADDGGPASPERAPSEAVELGRLNDEPPPALPARESPPVAAVAPPTAIPFDGLSLEQRLRRLEDALAQLQELRRGETRIVNLPAAPRPSSPPQPPPTAAPIPTAALLDMGKRLLGAASEAITPAPVPPSLSATARARAVWFLWDTWAEARAILRMFLDPRYHLPWSARVFPLVLLAAILTSKLWVPGSSILILGDVLVKLVDLLLAFMLFKWLGHEARRYRQTSPDLPPSLRL